MTKLTIEQQIERDMWGIEPDPLAEPAQEVSDETKKFIRDRIGRIQFKSAGAKRER